MDIKSYISSGVLELYVLDLLPTPAERAEVEGYAAQYPEIRAEITAIELALEAYAQANAKPVSKTVLLALLNELRSRKTDLPGRSAGNQPPLSPNTGAGLNWLPWLLAGILAISSVFLYLNGTERTEELSLRATTLQTELDNLRQDCDQTYTALRNSELRNRTLTNPATRSVRLAGTDNAPESEALVFYNSELDQTLFRANRLPTPPTGRQYQLWALVEGQPFSIGVLDTDLADDALIEVDYVADAGTFAITLEETGGKDSPDLSQLQVIGNL